METLSRRALVLGSGGREHALAHHLKLSGRFDAVYALPGNAGMAEEGIVCLAGNAADGGAVRGAVRAHGISFVLVGPEQPLVEGVVDALESDPELANVLVLGPDRSGARLEASKSFAKRFMERHGVPTARYGAFTLGEVDAARRFLGTLRAPYVLKADGLAAGKGVLILPTLSEAEAALESLLAGQFGQASRTVVIEEHLRGREMSLFVLTDGVDYVLLPHAKDYKRALDGDEGLNTGGMGAISPVPWVDDVLLARIRERVVEPTVRGIAREGMRYRGFLFLGLMVDEQGDPYLLEYNARLGDPETQVVVPRLPETFTDLMLGAAAGTLGSTARGVAMIPSSHCTVGISLVSEGYPVAFKKGYPIALPHPVPSGCQIYHAGTAYDGEKQLVSQGGRVLTCVGSGSTLAEARESAYRLADRVHFANKRHRHDIGLDAL